MDCDEFLRGYSGFRDRRFPPPVRERYREHLEECASCRRYDHVLCRGVQLLRSLPSPRPSADFFPRLKHRIYHIEDGSPLSDSSPGGGAALAALAAVGILALAWLPFALQPPSEVELDPVAVEPSGQVEAASPSLFGSGPFVTPLLHEAASPRTAAPSGSGWRSAGEREGAVRLLPAAGADPASTSLQLR
jgi:hypothetical protein